jgi:oligosaccharyltransferase complex subunit epsilon
VHAHTQTTKQQALDAFIVYALATAAVQCVYMLLVGTFPFNSFLAGVLCSLSFFSLTGAFFLCFALAACVCVSCALRGLFSRLAHSLTPLANSAQHHPNKQTPTTVCLRMQIDPSNKDFDGISPERAFADFALANGILFLAVWNYMG